MTIKERSNLMRNLKSIAVNAEWGSEEQVEAETLFYQSAADFGFDADNDEEFQAFSAKATTFELVEGAARIMERRGIVDPI